MTSSSWLPQLKTKFGTLDDASLAELEKMVQTFESAMIANKPKDRSEEPYLLKVRRAVGQLLHDLEILPEENGAKKIYFRLDARDLDFILGENVYSTTPRLLLKVPAAREPGATGYIDIPTIGNAVSPTMLKGNITEKTVLVIRNQEDKKLPLDQRPAVQESALSPGEYVLWGGLALEDRKRVYDIVAGVMNPPEGKSAFRYFDEAGTVEDLAKIVKQVQALGFANMYNSHEKYRTTNVQPLPALEGQSIDAQGLSGFYEKPPNAVLNSAIFLPGPILFIGRGRSEEKLPESGYAVFEQTIGAEDYNIRPQSPDFIAENYVYRRSRENVEKKPAKGLSQVMFKPDHPLRDFTREFEGFQYSLVDFNHGLHLKRKASPDFKATAG